MLTVFMDSGFSIDVSLDAFGWEGLGRSLIDSRRGGMVMVALGSLLFVPHQVFGHRTFTFFFVYSGFHFHFLGYFL